MDYRPTTVKVASSPLGPVPLPAAPPAGADLVLVLAPSLAVRRVREATELHALALALARDARTVHIEGGRHGVRRGVAYVLGTAYPDRITWRDPRRPGVSGAPCRHLREPNPETDTTTRSVP